MQVDFYQLSRDPVERVLPRIAQRILDDGGRLLVVNGREGALDRISAALWDDRPDSFLANGLATQEGAAVQPILLSAGTEAANGARFIALADGLWRDEALEFARAFTFFDEQSIADARTSWKALKARDGVEPRYWRQDGSKWVSVA